MKWDENLNGTGLQIAKTNDSPLRVMAGPGTGKSFVMMRRVARLLEEGIDPKAILTVTFTRTAANCLINDLAKLNIAGCENIDAGTLHSLCFKLLQKHDVLKYLGREPRALITSPKQGNKYFEAAPLIADLRTINPQFGTQKVCKSRMDAFSAAWARLQSQVPGWPSDQLDRIFHKHLIDWLKFHRGMLIGELIPLTLDYINNHPECDLRHKYLHVVVDEYQDLNKAEQSLLDIISLNGSFAIVGDEDQSIYSFRFAHPEGIREFNHSHPKTHDENLIECRRCPQRVVNIANALILNNHPDNTNRLICQKGNLDGEVKFVTWRNFSEETKGIAGYINYLIQSEHYKPADFLVLTPRRKIGYEIRDILKDKGLDVHSFYYEEALETQEGQNKFCLFNLFIDKTDRVALRYWLGCNSKTWNASQYNKLRKHSEKVGIPPFELLEKITSGDVELSGITKITDSFKELKSSLNKMALQSPRETIDYLFPENQDWSSILREACLLKLDELQKEEHTSNNKDINFLRIIFDYLKSITTQPEMPNEGKFVRIMSLHKSKGLTNKVVIIAGCVQGLIPFIDQKMQFQADTNNLIAEQRRLLYVAMTRATDILILSAFDQIERAQAHKLGVSLGKGGTKEIGNTRPSQFYSELGKSAPEFLSGDRWARNNYC